ncbi:MAG: hypothetical protein QOC84_1900 [Bradyrhizobium sp.]|nr:hypothetical protein [Bradyrhizobium sp.]
MFPVASFAQSAAPGPFTGASTQLTDSTFQGSSNVWNTGGAAVISGPVGSGAGNAAAGTLDTARVWGKTFGFDSHVGADANAPGTTTRGVGGAVGVERLLQPNLLVGAAFGYTAASTTNPLQNVKADTAAGAIYSSYALNGFEFNGLAGVNGSHFDSMRVLTVNGALTPFQGTAHGLGWNVYGDAGYRFLLPTTFGAAYVKPFVGLNYYSLDRSASTEFSSGGLALNYGAQTFNRFTSLLGVDFGATYAIGGGYVRPEFRLGWSHEYIDPAPPVFATLAGTTIVTRDPEPGNDGLVIGAQLTMWSRQNLQLFVGYNGEFRRNLESHQGTAGLRVSW